MSSPDLVVIDDFVDAALRARLLAQVWPPGATAPTAAPKASGAQLDGFYADNPGRHTVQVPAELEARIRVAIAGLVTRQPAPGPTPTAPTTPMTMMPYVWHALALPTVAHTHLMPVLASPCPPHTSQSTPLCQNQRPHSEPDPHYS